MTYESPEQELLHLKAKVKEMLDAQQAYFKSGKDFQLLKVSKAIESDVRQWVNPKPVVTKAQLEFWGK